MVTYIYHHKPEQTAALHKAFVERAEKLKAGENPSAVETKIDTTIPQRLTIAARQLPSGEIDIAYSACCWGDNFCKRTGRRIAIQRLGNPGHTTVSSRFARISSPADDQKKVYVAVTKLIPFIIQEYADKKRRYVTRQ